MSSELPISDQHPNPGLLGPNSVTWRLHEEQWLITAGARAFLMQAAHPKVAQGALDHSGFAEDPFGHVDRTIQGMAVLIYSSGNNFILPVIPDYAAQGMLREQLKFNLNSSIRA